MTISIHNSLFLKHTRGSQTIVAINVITIIVMLQFFLIIENEGCSQYVNIVNIATSFGLSSHTVTDCSNYDDCLTSPCQNGATCIDDITADNYTCQCVPGYVGEKTLL